MIDDMHSTEKYLLLSAIEHYLVLTNTYSGYNNHLVDCVYKLAMYYSIEELEEYLINLKKEFLEYQKVDKINIIINPN